jgi:iron only hydrogenase large subunit-like protein
VTSAEAVLVSLQSHAEVLNVLDSYPPLSIPTSPSRVSNGLSNGHSDTLQDGKIFIASVSPQVRASLAATYNISERKAGFMIDQFLRGPNGLRRGGKYNNGFTWVVDTNSMREVCLDLAAKEVADSLSPESISPKRPILTSACPGWICYAEKTHPHVLPHLSRLKSPQALTGTLLKSVLSQKLNIHPSQIWHVALMPCFDKKLEASREELTDQSWYTPSSSITSTPVRDVDCVITTRELLTLATARSVTLSSLPLKSLPPTPFPDANLSPFLFPPHTPYNHSTPAAGPSGGYLHHILATTQRQHPGSTILTTRGRNSDVVDYVLLSPSNQAILKCARYYGFRNIQNLVRKLKPPKSGPRLPGTAARGGIRRPGQATAGGRDALATEYAYVEVMACPGGCTNGGGQIRVEDVKQQQQTVESADSMDGIEASTPIIKAGPAEQKEWLAKVDEAYFSASSDTETDGEDAFEDGADVSMSNADPQPLSNGHSQSSKPLSIPTLLAHWSTITSVPLEKLVYTTYRAVESDVGKNRPGGGIGDTERVVELAGRVGGGW